MADLNGQQAGSDNHDSYDHKNYWDTNYDTHYEYGSSMLEVFTFEPTIYLYLWPILVILVSSVNVIVVSVLLRGSMRSSTNMILAAIAIADSLTGLVTLPTYISVYNLYEGPSDYPTGGHWSNSTSHLPPYYIDNYTAQLNEHVTEPNDSSVMTISPSALNKTVDSFLNMSTTMDNLSYASKTTSPWYRGVSTFFDLYDQHEYSPGVSVLSEDLCTYYMISKHFLSKSCHTVSIFLTLFLGFQRYVSVAYPFRAQKFFTTMATAVVCAIIFVVSPVLHIYHFLKTGKQQEEDHGLCAWNLPNCKEDCAYLWIIFAIRHFVPCTLLTVFTVLFISELRNGKQWPNKAQSRKRLEENRRISMVVTAIVILFLIPEIPFGLFLLFSVIWRHAEMAPDLKTNRAIHAAYELTLLVSFHLNFYIYTFLNKGFRDGLRHTFLSRIRRVFGYSTNWFPSRSESSSKQPGAKKTKETNDSENSSQQATKRYLARITEESAGNQSSDGNNGGIEMVVMNESSSMVPAELCHL